MTAPHPSPLPCHPGPGPGVGPVVGVVRRPRPALAPLVVACLALAGAVAGALLGAPPAWAAASVGVSGPAVAADAPTTVTVSGTGFQSIPGAFGGIYVVFGWVSDPAGGTWKPSAGGSTGADYRYAPDSESTDNQGFQRFVAFPGSDTAAAANGGVIAADGTWSTELVIPGARFSAQDRSGAHTEVDCTRVTCGVITVGAHGVVNPSNETFTPIAFDVADGQPTGAAGPGSGSAAGSGSGSGTADAAADAPAERAPATLGVDRATAVQGRAMTFSAQGFEPGEQVVATLDSGVVSVGPLTAGAHGEVAGVLQLPADLRLGTHVLRLTGAQSGLVPEVEVTVTRDPAEATAADLLAASAGAGDDGGVPFGASPAETAVAVAGLLLLVVVVVSAVTARRRRRAARRVPSPGPPPVRAPATAPVVVGGAR